MGLDLVDKMLDKYAENTASQEESICPMPVLNYIHTHGTHTHPNKQLNKINVRYRCM